MIIYNVAIKVDNTIADRWMNWLKEEHIPDIIKTGCFTHAVILHLFENDDEEGITFAVQYHAESKSHYYRYIENFADTMRKKSIDKWGEKIVTFRTVMQVVH